MMKVNIKGFLRKTVLIKESKCATIYSCTFWSKDDIMLIKERIIWDRKTN